MAKKKAQTKRLKNPKWEKFCLCYTNNRQLFGNATHAYAEANNFKLDSLSHDDAVYEEERDDNGKFISSKLVESSSYDKAVNECAVEGARLLRNPKINQRINDLLNELFHDEIIDAELSWVIMQREDLGPKVAAIREFNSLKKRTKNGVEVTFPPPFDEDTKNKSKNAVKDFLTRGNPGKRG